MAGTLEGKALGPVNASSQAIPASARWRIRPRAAAALIPDRVTSHRVSALGHGTGTVRGRPTASPSMTDVTRILSAIEQGDAHAAEQLLPLVYEELRKLAAAKLAQEKPGQTLDATALVHEAYLRLVGDQPAVQARDQWNSRGHFFAAAAEAMRRIVIENARGKARQKRGG